MIFKRFGRLGLALSAACTMLIGLAIFAGQRIGGQAADSAAPQCGHWAVYHICQLHGVPIELREIVAMLPVTRREGLSFAELKSWLEGIGFTVRGRQVAVSDLKTLVLPANAAVDDGHFVVVERVEAGRVALRNTSARQLSVALDRFLSGWRGQVLEIVAPHSMGLPKLTDPPTEPRPAVRFNRLTEHRCVRASDGPVVFEFPLVSVGTADLVINSVQTDCDCATAEYSKSPIPPGGIGSVRVRYNGSRDLAAFSRSATVVTNDAHHATITLTLTGEFTDADLIQVEPRELNFGQIVEGQDVTRTLIVQIDGARAVLSGPAEVNLDCARVVPKAVAAPAQQPESPLTEVNPGIHEFDVSLRGPRHNGVLAGIATLSYKSVGAGEGEGSIQSLRIPVKADCREAVTLHPAVFVIDRDAKAAHVTLVSNTDESLQVVAAECLLANASLTVAELRPGVFRLELFSKSGAFARLADDTEVVRAEVAIGSGNVATRRQLTIRAAIVSD